MFDVHYHLIFGVDDGPKTLEDSLALAEASIAEGVTHIVATPHSSFRYQFQPEINRERFEILNRQLQGRLTLGLGCDFHLSLENIADLHRNPQKYTINGKQYLLVEFADFAISRITSQVLREMVIGGVVPIITHPERNPVLAADPERIRELVDEGCLVQVTAGSLCGDFGRKIESITLDLIRKDLVHLVASDAHSMNWRPPSMGRAHKLITATFGRDTADRLCIHVPRVVFFGEQLASTQEDDLEPPGRRQSKRSYFSRLFGR
jgi:protein-tyrosine phosphatase